MKTLWQTLIEEHGHDRPELRNQVAQRLHDAHHITAGQDAPPFSERERVVKVSWLARADVLLRRVEA